MLFAHIGGSNKQFKAVHLGVRIHGLKYVKTWHLSWKPQIIFMCSQLYLFPHFTLFLLAQINNITIGVSYKNIVKKKILL